jgi:hypothetical protein
VKGRLPPLAGKTFTSFVESRISVALRTTFCIELPNFVLVTLGDLEDVTVVRTLRDGWSNAKLMPCLECTGIVAFQFTIYLKSTVWAKEWINLLNFIDKSLTAEVNSGVS